VIREISARLKIKSKTVLADLAALMLPPAAKDANELLNAMGQIQPLRLAQDFREGVLWFGVIAGEMKLLVNSRRELLTLDKLPDGLRVKDQGFDLCRISKEAILRFVGGEVCADLELVTNGASFLN
jgi:hypothetical protein